MTRLHLISLLLLSAQQICARAINSPHELVQHEKIDVVPRGWTLERNAEDDEPLSLRIALAHTSKKYLEAAEEISDPSSRRYGQHLSGEELAALLPDTKPAAEAVTSWLRSHSVQDIFEGRDWLEFSSTAGHVKEILSAEFGAYSFANREPVLRTKEYSVPKHLLEHIDFIYPTVHFFSPTKISKTPIQRRQHIPTGPITCKDHACPDQLQKKYNINYRPKDGSSGSKIGIAGFLDTFPNATDVKNFQTKYGSSKNAAPSTYDVKSYNKGTTVTKGGASSVEPNLDLEYSLVFTGPLPATFYSTGGRGVQLQQPGNKPLATKDSQNEPYLEFLQSLLAEKSPPSVISISYSDDEQSIGSEAYARRVCDLFAQAAARGISIIGSSGDGGASGSGGNTQCLGPKGQRRFIPTFPSSCPWITSVGATASYGGVASFSSGGFSNIFARPSWQASQVQGYIKALNGSHKAYYNASGRAVPDVSLLGDDYLILNSGFAQSADGTSASTPVFAAMIALINDIRLRAGKPVLGFLNPLLYSSKLAGVFRDVKDGSNSVGCADGNFFETGWEALAGWDAGTGLGEPDFQKLRTALAS